MRFVAVKCGYCCYFLSVLSKMDEIQLVAFYYFLRALKKSRKREKLIHEITAAREKEGGFQILFSHLINDPKKFFHHSLRRVVNFAEKKLEGRT